MSPSKELPRTSEGYIWEVALGTLTKGLQSPAVRADNSTTYPKHYDVIVIGAGFAGLSAARDLSVSGKQVLLLEARDRIGGRTWVAKGKHHTYEMGGGWVHWLQPNVWSELSRYGLTNVQPSDVIGKEEIISISGTQENPTPTQLSMEDATVRLSGLLEAFFNVDGANGRTVIPNPHRPHSNLEAIKKYDISVSDRVSQLDISDVDKRYLTQWLNTNGAASPDVVGFLHILRLFSLSNYDYNTEMELSGKFKVPGGTTALAAAMFAEFQGTSLFGRPVSSITTGSDSATVSLKNGEEFTADHVICTVPLNCLYDVKFDPPFPVALPLKHASTAGKVHIHSEKQIPIWFGIGDHEDTCSFAFAESTSAVGGTNLVLFPGSGFLAKKAVEDDPKGFINSLHKHLVPECVGLKVADMAWHDWLRDPYAKGPWASLAAGQLSGTVGEIMQQRRISKRVILASADIALGWLGYIDGAIEQGRSAAFDVGEKLKAKAHI